MRSESEMNMVRNEILKHFRSRFPFKYPNLKGYRITIMGLGLHGGGLTSSLFFLKTGADITITDLKTEEMLSTTVERLKKESSKENNFKLILGRHREEDFKNTDMIIKNPGVPSSSKYLKIAQERGIPIETDISIFLRMTNNPVIAVTGSKGKSTTTSAIHYILQKEIPTAQIGGNITLSPLSFIEKIEPSAPIVLELSSWQLADIRNKKVLNPQIAIITNIMHDHQDKYGSMEDYINDKAVILENQNNKNYTILNIDDTFHTFFLRKTKALPLFVANKPLVTYPNTVFPLQGAYIENERGYIQLRNTPRIMIREKIKLKGHHNKKNLLTAGLTAFLLGIKQETIIESLYTYGGLEHRMELFYIISISQNIQLSFYNDSAATIPEATARAIESLPVPLILITGGTDKKLDFKVLSQPIKKPDKIFLLKGSATEKLVDILQTENIGFNGPYHSLEKLLRELKEYIEKSYTDPSKSEEISVLFSPGSASFELFNNEFHRGDSFKKLVKEIFQPTLG